MKVLVISTHPDDETLGCAGTLLKHKKNEDSLHWIIATTPHTPKWSEEVIVRKELEIETVSGAYRMDSVQKLGFPTVMLDTLPITDVIGALETKISKINPDIIYLVHGGDVHTDHQVVFNATLAVLKPFKMSRIGVKKILAFETLSSTDAAYQSPSSAFLPNIYIDISDFMDDKLDIMRKYESEAQPDPMPRSNSAITALARFRGATIGTEYAEAFMLIREIG